MTNQNDLQDKPIRGRPKTNPNSRSEQLRKNSALYRDRQSQNKRDLKNKVNQILIPNLAIAIDFLQNKNFTRSQRIEQVTELLKKTSKQWDEEINVSRHKGLIKTSRSVQKK